MSSRKVVWLVEDSPEDLEAFEIAAKQVHFSAELRSFSTGQDFLNALDDLKNDVARKKLSWPSLLILDLNLPGLGGREILKRTKEHLGYLLPIIIFSTSSHPTDVEFCYRFGASAYLVKPMSLDRLEKTLDALNLFWLSSAVLPLHSKYTV